MYPDAVHILPSQVSEYPNFIAMPEGSFIYVPASDYEKLPEQSIDLFSNFFSLGEMKRDFFNIYIRSKLFRYSKNNDTAMSSYLAQIKK